MGGLGGGTLGRLAAPPPGYTSSRNFPSRLNMFSGMRSCSDFPERLLIFTYADSWTNDAKLTPLQSQSLTHLPTNVPHPRP